MVSVYTKGRYANGTWQQMAAWVYAKKYGLEYSAPKQSLAPNVWPTYHQHLQNPNWDDSLEIVEVNDGKHSYVELPFKEEWRDKNIMIGTKSVETGYFQSWRYIDGYQIELKNAFRMIPDTLWHMPVINPPAIHVRRSDYLNYPTKHPVITESYLIEAVERVKREYRHYFSTSPSFIFYSDDIPWCKEFVNSKYEDRRGDFFYSEGKSEMEDFVSMVYSSYLITSNSSFSVLAGILNTQAKMVICPHEDSYFGVDNKHLDVATMYPDNWIRIKY